jgi:hypothetical protein
MQIRPDGNISYNDTKNLGQMTLFDDDRLQIGFEYENQIWTDVTLPLVTGAGRQWRARRVKIFSPTRIPIQFTTCGWLDSRI